MFKVKDRVKVDKPINFQGPSPWLDMTGTVIKTEPKWVTVLLDEISLDVPFRERELVKIS